MSDVVSRLRDRIEAWQLWVLHEIDPKSLLPISSVPTLIEEDQLVIGNVMDVMGDGLCK